MSSIRQRKGQVAAPTQESRTKKKGTRKTVPAHVKFLREYYAAIALAILATTYGLYAFGDAVLSWLCGNVVQIWRNREILSRIRRS